jgi:hypothetical protein
LYLRHWSTASVADFPSPASDAYCATYSKKNTCPFLRNTIGKNSIRFFEETLVVICINSEDKPSKQQQFNSLAWNPINKDPAVDTIIWLHA